MEFNFVDGVVLFIVVVSTVLAWSRGLLREVFSILGWIVALIVAASFAYLLVPIVRDLPVVGEYIVSCELQTGVAFVILFIISMFVMAIITPLISNWTDGTVLSGFDGALGAVFGLFRGLLVVLLLVIAYDNLLSKSLPYDPIEKSRSYSYFTPSTAEIENALPEDGEAPGFLIRQFDRITSHCTRTDVQDAETALNG